MHKQINKRPWPARPSQFVSPTVHCLLDGEEEEGKQEVESGELDVLFTGPSSPQAFTDSARRKAEKHVCSIV